MKLTAKELRIGNWIKSEPLTIPRLNVQSNGYMQITGYGISVLESDTTGKLPWKPIPLTEEILNKCDEFTTSYWRTDCWTLRQEESQFHIYKQKNRFLFRGVGMSIIYVDTVHHLQNLVYVNTLKELEIKL